MSDDQNQNTPPAPPPPASVPPAAPAVPSPPVPVSAHANTVPPVGPGDAPSLPSTEVESKGPAPDLSKRFHMKQGKEVVATFDTKEEAVQAKSDYSTFRSDAIAKAAVVSHKPSPVIVDTGVKFKP